MRDKLSKMADLVQENVDQVQKRQKRWYDKNARSRSFGAGDKVLVLLPSSASNLQALWQGPYTVIRQTSPVDYEIQLTNKRKKKQILHVNLLRKWQAREECSFLVNVEVETDDIVGEVLLPVQQMETRRDVTLDGSLSDEQRREAAALL
jgi:hypothetical protein